MLMSRRGISKLKAERMNGLSETFGTVVYSEVQTTCLLSLRACAHTHAQLSWIAWLPATPCASKTFWGCGSTKIFLVLQYSSPERDTCCFCECLATNGQF